MPLRQPNTQRNDICAGAAESAIPDTLLNDHPIFETEASQNGPNRLSAIGEPRRVTITLITRVSRWTRSCIRQPWLVRLGQRHQRNQWVVARGNGNCMLHMRVILACSSSDTVLEIAEPWNEVTEEEERHEDVCGDICQPCNEEGHVDCLVLECMVAHAAQTVNRFHVGKDGRIAHYRQHLKNFGGPTFESAESSSRRSHTQTQTCGRELLTQIQRGHLGW